MIDLSKYSEKDVFAAVRAVEEIVDMEDFGLFVDEDEGELCFALEDHQGANLGDIESDRFDSLGGVLDRMEIYHNDYLYEDYQERVCNKVEIPQDDWCRKAILFLESGFCQDLLMDIDVETYQKYKDKELDEVGIDSDEIEKYVADRLLHSGDFDAVGYLLDKDIALKIMDTQSAYDVVEYKGVIYELYNPDVPGVSIVEFEEALETGNFSDFEFWVHETFADLIDAQKKMILDDFHDIGFYDDEGNWEFYLSEYELEYIGLGVEKDKALSEYKAVDELVSEASERSENFAGESGQREVEREM